MPPNCGNGKICCTELPAAYVARSAACRLAAPRTFLAISEGESFEYVRRGALPENQKPHPKGLSNLNV